MDLEKEFKEKTGLDAYIDNNLEPKIALGYYVEFLEEQLLIQRVSKSFYCDWARNGVINCPDELEPVLAKIEHINSLGNSKWYEVVYYDGNWCSYSGSNTFNDGEKVVKWKYCKGCL